MDQKSAASGGASVPALRRAVAILDYLSDRSDDATAAQITRDLAMPKSTAHGLLQAMEEMGLLRRMPAGTYLVGARPLRWGANFLSRSDLVDAFKQYFATQSALSDLTITMTVLDGADVVYIACTNSAQPLGVTFRPGMRLPAPFTATGKALLATLEEGEIDRILAPAFPAPLTRHSLRNLADLKRDLARQAARGFSIDDGETREGMICLGAPVFNHEGRAVAGLALSLTRSEASAGRMLDLGTRLTEAAGALSRKLGAA